MRKKKKIRELQKKRIKIELNDDDNEKEKDSPTTVRHLRMRAVTLRWDSAGHTWPAIT